MCFLTIQCRLFACNFCTFLDCSCWWWLVFQRTTSPWCCWCWREASTRWRQPVRRQRTTRRWSSSRAQAGRRTSSRTRAGSKRNSGGSGCCAEFRTLIYRVGQRKMTPYGFCLIYSAKKRNTKIKFYRPIGNSFLRITVKFHQIIWNGSKVISLLVRPPDWFWWSKNVLRSVR